MKIQGYIIFFFYLLAANGLRYVFVADFEALTCQVIRKFIRCRNAETRTIPAINIPHVTAWCSVLQSF